jgi:hypothetical protein
MVILLEMKLLIIAWLFGLIVACLPADAESLQFLPTENPQSVFGANAQKISVMLYNPDKDNFSHQIRARILQATSATAVSHSAVPWKKVRVLPGQTILESAPLDFPVVKAETQFLVRWLDDANRVIGATSVLVYPTNLLQALQPFLSRTNFGVLDPGNQLKPLLKAQGISFKDLGEINLDHFSGRLAIIGPFESKAQMPEDLPNRIRTIAEKNVAVVWIQPPQRVPLSPLADWGREKIQPSFYSVQKSQTAVVVVQPEMVSHLRENPQSQIALVYFCHLALNPQPATLPGLCSNDVSSRN